MSARSKLYQIRYKASRTVARFHASLEFVRALMGPVGSAKSSGCVMDIVMRAEAQKAYHGVRRFRAAVIRNTYPELKSTTIKTWLDWVPEPISKMKYDSPISCRAKWLRPDGTRVELEVYFVAMDKPKDVKKLLSLELTMAWINEAREVPKSVLEQLTARVGRYPSKRVGGPSWSGIIMDTNPPDDDHWWYKMFEEQLPEVRLPDGNMVRYEIYKQPPALLRLPQRTGGPLEFVPNPLAENIENLDGGYGYYFRQLPGKSSEWIKVYVESQYAPTADGRPVFPEYNDAVHCSAKPLEIYRALPLIIGFDFALNPACVIAQYSPRGQLRILREICAQNMGIRRCVVELLRPRLANEFPNMQIIGRSDPAGKQRSDTDEKHCYQILREEGIVAFPASTNKWIPRREAVAKYLTTMVDGEPGFILDPSCKIIRKGFLGNYRYARVAVVGQERYRDEPVKDEYSHPHDAVQYIALGATNTGEGQSARGWSGAARPVEIASTRGWS